MPWLLAIIVQAGTWLFRNQLGLFIAQALLWLGLSYGTKTLVLDPASDLVADKMAAMSSASGLGASMWAWIGVLQFDVFVSMVISAIVAKQAFAATKVFLSRRAV